jgi:hypothetical protein
MTPFNYSNCLTFKNGLRISENGPDVMQDDVSLDALMRSRLLVTLTSPSFFDYIFNFYLTPMSDFLTTSESSFRLLRSSSEIDALWLHTLVWSSKTRHLLQFTSSF